VQTNKPMELKLCDKHKSPGKKAGGTRRSIWKSATRKVPFSAGRHGKRGRAREASKKKKKNKLSSRPRSKNCLSKKKQQRKLSGSREPEKNPEQEEGETNRPAPPKPKGKRKKRLGGIGVEKIQIGGGAKLK